jgi:hypothetical protein
MPALPQQPSSVSEILSASFKLYVDSFTKLIGYSLIGFVFNQLIKIFVTNRMPVVDTSPNIDEQITTMVQILPSVLGISFIVILFSCVLYSAVTYRIDNFVNDRDDDFFEVLLKAFKKFPAIILAGILYMLAVMVGSVLLVVPGIILTISLAFSWYFILLEDMGGYESLIASHRLVWGDWWRTNWVLCLPMLLLFIVFFIVAFFSGIFDATAEASTTLDTVLDLLAAAITPYFYVIGYVQYHDLKLRKKM